MISLKQHQVDAVEWLREHNWCGYIAGAPGTGKSYIAMEALRQAAPRKVLILTPASVVAQWNGSVIAPYTAQYPHMKSIFFYVTNYEKLRVDFVYKQILSQGFDAVVCDEMHRAKNPTSKTWKRLRRISPAIKILLSGSPRPNSLHELWTSAVYLGCSELETSWYKFRSIHCVTNPVIPQQIIGYRDKQYLDAVFRGYMHFIPKEVLDLKSVSRRVHLVQFSPTERKAYDKVHNECVIELRTGEKLTIPNMLVKLRRLSQLVDHPQFFELCPMNRKQEALSALLCEIDDKVIIFSESSECIKYLHNKFGGVRLIGEMPTRERVLSLDKFRDDTSCKYLWMSSAGAEGLNIQHCATVIQYGLPYHNDALVQRVSRSHRMFQTRDVTEHIIVVKDTVDERMWHMIQRKNNDNLKFTRQDYKNILEV